MAKICALELALAELGRQCLPVTPLRRARAWSKTTIATYGKRLSAASAINWGAVVHIGVPVQFDCPLKLPGCALERPLLDKL